MLSRAPKFLLTPCYIPVVGGFMLPTQRIKANIPTIARVGMVINVLLGKRCGWTLAQK